MSEAKENFKDAIAFLKNNGHNGNAEIILEYVEELEREQRLKSHVYPYNAFITDGVITFCYDESQRKPLGREDKIVFQLRTVSVDRLQSFVKSNARDLHLHSWVCMDGGEGYYSNTINEQLYNECFTIRLSECLHRMIESDNELKLSLLKSNQSEYYERNR